MTQCRLRRIKEVYPAGEMRSKCIHTAHLVDTVDIHTRKWFSHDSVQLACVLVDCTIVCLQHLIDPADALLYHYRSMPMQSVVDKNLTVIQDRTMVDRYGDVLKTNVDTVLRDV
jgi:hypothetical protein